MGTSQASEIKPVDASSVACLLEWGWGETDSKGNLVLIPQYLPEWLMTLPCLRKELIP